MIRAAGPADLAAVAGIVQGAYAPYIPRIGRPPAPMQDDHAAQIAAGWVSVALRDDVTVGVVVLMPQPGHLLLENVAVTPAWRRHGVGAALLRFAEAECRRLGLAEVRLYTHRLMAENIALYERIGYLETGRGRQAGLDRVFFSKPVAP